MCTSSTNKTMLMILVNDDDARDYFLTIIIYSVSIPSTQLVNSLTIVPIMRNDYGVTRSAFHSHDYIDWLHAYSNTRAIQHIVQLANATIQLAVVKVALMTSSARCDGLMVT